jgi:hypothetical protein
MAAPRNHLHTARNGSRMNPHRRLLGELGPTFRRDVQMAREYRRDLERLCLARHGEISVLHAHAIDCAAAFELHSSTCRWLIRTRLKDMTPSDVVVCSTAIAESKIKRNQQVALLKLDPPKADDDPLKTLYALPIPVLAEADPSPDAQDAPRAPAEPETVQEPRGGREGQDGPFPGLTRPLAQGDEL